jgi:hypothetical protein
MVSSASELAPQLRLGELDRLCVVEDAEQLVFSAVILEVDDVERAAARVARVGEERTDRGRSPRRQIADHPLPLFAGGIVAELQLQLHATQDRAARRFSKPVPYALVQESAPMSGTALAESRRRLAIRAGFQRGCFATSRAAAAVT